MSSQSVRRLSACYPFSERHLLKHQQKVVEGSYRVNDFADQLAKIHAVRERRMYEKQRRSSMPELSLLSSSRSSSSSAGETVSVESMDAVISVQAGEEHHDVLSTKRKILNIKPVEIPHTGDTPKKTAGSWFF